MSSPKATLETLPKGVQALLALGAIALAAFPLIPSDSSDFYLQMLSQMMILAIFAMSLDLLQGVTGLVSLGHAAFFGVGAYVAGLLAKHGLAEPVTGLLISGLAAGLTGAGASARRSAAQPGLVRPSARAASQKREATGGPEGGDSVPSGAGKRMGFCSDRSVSCDSCTGSDHCWAPGAKRDMKTEMSERPSIEPPNHTQASAPSPSTIKLAAWA